LEQKHVNIIVSDHYINSSFTVIKPVHAIRDYTNAVNISINITTCIITISINIRPVKVKVKGAQEAKPPCTSLC